LAALCPHFKGQEIEVERNGKVERDEPECQLALTLAEAPPSYGKAQGRAEVARTMRKRR